MAEDYEIHVTIDPKDLKNSNLITYCANHGWTMSQISDDEVIAGKNSYLTNHGSSTLMAMEFISLMFKALIDFGIHWKRAKIEHVVFDTRNPCA